MEEIFVPASGMAMEDALLTEWLKQPGESVEAGEPVAVVETDKAVVELSGETAGRLSRHLVEAGERVPGGAVVAYVLGDGEEVPADESDEGRAGLQAGGDEREGAPVAGMRALDDAGAAQAGSVAAPDERRLDGRHTLSPRQRRAALQQAGTPGWTASSSEVQMATDAVQVPLGEDLRSKNREATANRVLESWRTIPHFFVGRDLRAEGLDGAVRSGRATGAHVTVTDLFLLALSRSLTGSGESGDVGLAVATDWGLLVPVVRELEGASVVRVAELRSRAVQRARERRLGSSDAGPPPFATLSNLGMEGVSWFTGVVPVDQVVLLSVGEVSLRPFVDGGTIGVAPMFTAVVAADHRRYDGMDSARLLSAFADNLQQVIMGASQ